MPIRGRVNSKNYFKSSFGVTPEIVPYLYVSEVAPTADSVYDFYVGTVWLNRGTYDAPMEDVYILAKLSGGVATWVHLEEGGNFVNQITADAGVAVVVDGQFQLIGNTAYYPIRSTAAGNTLTFYLDDDGIDEGSILIGGTNGPRWGKIRSDGGSATITYGPNSLDISDNGLFGDMLQVHTDAGFAAPAAGIVQALGGLNIATTSAGNTVTVSMTDDITLAGAVPLTLQGYDFGIMTADNTGLIGTMSGDDGQIIVSKGPGQIPAFTNIVSNSLNIVNGANTITISNDAPGSAPFMYIQSVDVANVCGDATFYELGAGAILTDLFDVGDHVYPGDGVGARAYFTAPTTGTYFLGFMVTYSFESHAAVWDPGYLYLEIITTARNYIQHTRLGTDTMRSTGYYDFRNTGAIEATVDMTAGDTAYFRVAYDRSDANSVNILGSNEPVITYIYGQRVS